jgi:hypothetical protein
MSNAAENRMNSSLPNIDRPKNSTPIYDLDDVISHEGAGKIVEDDEIEHFDVKKGLAAQKANLHQLEVINEEIVAGYGTRTHIDDKSKIVHKNNGEMLISKSFAD